MDNQHEYMPKSLTDVIAESPWQQKAFLALGGVGLAGLINGAGASFVEATKDVHHQTVSHSEHLYTLISQYAMVPSFGTLVAGAAGVIYATKFREQ
jgi:hypothetical protein